MGARTYCQDIGRFLQPDPLFEAFARHTSYHYSFNSPLVWLDPSGLAPEKEKGEERLLQFEYDPIMFGIMENNYQEGIQERNSTLLIMQIRAEIFSILSTISDQFYNGNIPRTGSIIIGDTHVNWSMYESATDYSLNVNIANNGLYLNYSETGTITDGKLSISNISITTNVKQANVLGWLKGVHSGIKGSVAKGEKPRNAIAGITIYGNRETGETFLDAVQMGLDVAGVIDPSGICDLFGAILSFGRGDYYGGLISAAGIIGLDALKLGKVARFGDEASGITKLADDILEWLGEGANPYLNDAGDRYFMSFEGDRIVRFDFNNYSPHHQEHIHFIEYRIKNGKKKEIFNKRIYPKK